VPFPWQTRQRERFLVDRSGRNRVDRPRVRIADRGDDRVVRGPASLGRQPAWPECREFGRGMRPIEPRLAHLEHLRIRGRLDGDLGPDPCRVTNGDADSSFFH